MSSSVEDPVIGFTIRFLLRGRAVVPANGKMRDLVLLVNNNRAAHVDTPDNPRPALGPSKRLWAAMASPKLLYGGCRSDMLFCTPWLCRAVELILSPAPGADSPRVHMFHNFFCFARVERSLKKWPTLGASRLGLNTNSFSVCSDCCHCFLRTASF